MKDEMMYFKRELLNREENYNSKFNSKPNVGVMQVLKSKDDAKPATKTSNKPTNFVGAPGMGMGVGVGAPVVSSSSSVKSTPAIQSSGKR
jgi:hypothetical protein